MNTDALDCPMTINIFFFLLAGAGAINVFHEKKGFTILGIELILVDWKVSDEKPRRETEVLALIVSQNCFTWTTDSIYKSLL